MPSSMNWLAVVIRLTIAPVLFGALALLVHLYGVANDLAAATGLLLLALVHILYWLDPWQRSPRQAGAALAAMLVINFALLNLLGLDEPLLWLYPALIAGAGLRAPVAAVGIGLTALAAAAPLAFPGGFVHNAEPLQSTAEALSAGHSVLLSIVLAGLGMTAVRQLIAANADLYATRAELADLAVAADRERLERELHDLLARTLSLIAVKAELASRLSARGDAGAAAELADVQRLARQAVRDVREAVSGSVSPSLETELAAAEIALHSAGIHSTIEKTGADVDPAFETTLAWAVREAVTNVVRHSGARTCWIRLRTTASSTTLEIEDDGRGPVQGGDGTGLHGLADRVHALGGTLEVRPREHGGFCVRVRFGVAAPRPTNGALTT
jgi:two-component system sensor histidine kinase DesK